MSTVRLLPAGIYHLRVLSNGQTHEHVTLVPIRVTPTAYVLYCAQCPAVTVWKKDVPCEDLRLIEGLIAGGFPITPIEDAPNDYYDPLLFAKEDGLIIDVVPQGHNERRALAHRLRS